MKLLQKLCMKNMNAGFVTCIIFFCFNFVTWICDLVSELFWVFFTLIVFLKNHGAKMKLLFWVFNGHKMFRRLFRKLLRDIFENSLQNFNKVLKIIWIIGYKRLKLAEDETNICFSFYFKENILKMLNLSLF